MLRQSLVRIRFYQARTASLCAVLSMERRSGGEGRCRRTYLVPDEHVSLLRPITPGVWGRVVLVKKTASFLDHLAYLGFASSIRSTSVCGSLV